MLTEAKLVGFQNNMADADCDELQKTEEPRESIHWFNISSLLECGEAES